MKDLYRAINALNEISQAERDAMRAQAQADRNVGLKALGRLPKTKAELDQEIRDFAKQQRAASKAAGYATKAEYDAAYQKNLDAIKASGINLDDFYAAANKMASTEKGAAKLAKMGIQDDDDLISYVMAKAGIKDVTPDKYTATDFAITDIPEDELTFETEEALDERVTYATLAKLSGIENPDKIYPGQKITLPGGSSYTVSKGDTLSGIAQAYRLGQIGKKSPPPVADKKPNANTPYVPVTTGDKPKDDFKGRYQSLPNTFSTDKDGKITPASAPMQPKKNAGPAYQPIDKDSMSNLEKAKAYQKMVKAPSLTTPAVTPAVKAADDAIGKSGEKAVDAVKKDYEKSYTKKGVDSIYNTIRNLFK